MENERRRFIVNAQVEAQLDAEISLCEAIADLIREYDYSVYDVRYAVGAFTGQILGGLRQSDPEAATQLARPRLSSVDGAGSLQTRWASHSHGFLVDV